MFALASIPTRRAFGLASSSRRGRLTGACPELENGADHAVSDCSNGGRLEVLISEDLLTHQREIRLRIPVKLPHARWSATLPVGG